MACVLILLEADPEMNCYKATDVACKNGHFSIVKLLVEHQPQIIGLASSGASPCLLGAAAYGAVSHQQLEMLSFLLEKGVNPNAHPSGSSCPLAMALIMPVSAASLLGVIQLLIRAGADVNKLVEIPDRYLYPSFQAFRHYVTANPSKNVLKMLIEAGLNLSVREQKTGNTLLHFRPKSSTNENRHLPYLCYQIHEWEKNHPPQQAHSRSFLDTPNADGYTPLKVAVVHADLPLMTALLECGAGSKRATFPDQPSGLHWLVLEEKEELLTIRRQMVKLLLQHGVSTDKVYPDTGRTPP